MPMPVSTVQQVGHVESMQGTSLILCVRHHQDAAKEASHLVTHLRAAASEAWSGLCGALAPLPLRLPGGIR